MSLREGEYGIIKAWRDKLPMGDRMAILGDCNFAYGSNTNIGTFKRHLKFSKIDTFDVNGNPTVNLNLNDKLKPEYTGQYDWVLDAGTCYCCFSPGVVFENMHRMIDVHVPGVIISWAALFGFTNRGFYTFHPALYIDVFNTNGYTILGSYYRLKSSGWHPLKDINMFNADSSVPNDILIMYVAQRKEYRQFVAPIPSHFIRTGGK